MEEYQSLSGTGYFSLRDSKLFLKIEIGNLSIKLNQQNVDNCVCLWKMVVGGDIEYEDYYDLSMDHAYYVTNRYCELNNIPISFGDDSKFEGSNANQACKVLEWFYRSFAAPIADTICDDFNEETDFVSPMETGIKYIMDEETPGSGNVLITSSIDMLYHRMIKHTMYKDYMSSPNE